MSDEIVKTDCELAPGKSDELERVLEDELATTRPNILAIAESFRRCQYIQFLMAGRSWQCGLEAGHGGPHGEAVPASRLKEEQWVCAKCDYMNVGPICTKCGSCIPRYLTGETYDDYLKAVRLEQLGEWGRKK